MKKLLKIFGYVILSIFILIVILAVTASLSQKRIVDIALKEINETVHVPIEIEDLSFTFIKRFPFATIELSGVTIGEVETISTEPESKSGDDILNIKNVFVSVKTKPLFKGEFEIIKVEIDDATLNYKVDSLGNSNIKYLIDAYSDESTDVSDSTQSNSSTLPKLDLKKVKLKNIAIYYADDSAQIKANLFFPVMDIVAKLANEKYEGTVAGNLQLNKCSFGTSNLNRMEEATFDFELDYKSDTLQIKKFGAVTEGANLAVTGKMAFANNLFTDLTIESDGLELGKLMKYVPDSILSEYGVEDINGILRLSGTVKGNVSDSIVPAINLAFNLKNGNTKIKDYPIIHKLDFDGKFSNGSKQNNKTSSVSFKSFRAATDSSKIDISLFLSNFDKPKYTLNSKLAVDIEEFKDFIPDSLIRNISGKIVADFSTKGQMPDSIDDNYINLVINNTSANFDFSNFNIERDSFIVNDFSGSLFFKSGELEMNNINVSIPVYGLNLSNSSFNAEYTGPVLEPQNLAVHLKAFNIEAPQGKIWGSAKIQNLEHPDFVVDASVNLNLDQLKPFLPDTLIRSISGNLAAEINTYGKLNLDSITEQINDIVFKQSKFTLDARNISLTMPDTLQKLTNFNGAINMWNDTIFISKMNGVAAGIDFSFDSTTIVNIYDAVIKNQNKTVFVYGNLEFGAIDYSNLSSFIPAESTENTNINTTAEDAKTNDSEQRNFLFELKGKIAAKSIKYEKLFVENISAKFNLNDSVYIIDQFKLNAFDGSLNSSLRFSISGNDNKIANVKTDIKRMNISKFMFAFDNFGQDSLISHENISGLFSTVLNSRLVLDSDTLVTNDMRVMGDLTLESGRIINYKPAMDVAKFTGIKELDNIELKTLKSSIFIFKNKIFVPVTDVVSSAMDLSAFGMQSFGDNYEYHLQMHMGDVLKGKSKKLIERQNSSGDAVSKEDMDRSTIKIIYANIDGKAKTGFDKKKAQKTMALKIQVQQKMLDLIFHPKLISFETGVK